MGPNIDKLLVPINGDPLVVHTWRQFDRADCLDEIVVVVRDGQGDAFAALAARYQFKKPFRLTTGGAQRQDSVWNGLTALSSGAEIVAIQDAARPCTSKALLAATIDAARQIGAAVAAQPVTDTIKESRDGQFIQATPNRSHLWAVQTPQTFRVDVIRRALAEVRRQSLLITDDTAACELIGQPVKLVLSHEPNPKVTRAEDIRYVEQLLLQRVD
jgi:2-C-methyl-D-erythritol 4-phosphate cytidylyltransferase